MRIWASIWVVMGFLFLSTAAQAAAPGESAGIALENTRVIYRGSEKNGITFTVTNRTGQVYLLQSRVAQWGASPSASSSAAPFIVIPPLARFASDDALSLRIRLTKQDLPTDRESVFGLSLKAIPSQSAPGSESEAEAKMILALQNNLKLFYRPTELAEMTAEVQAQALEFGLHGTELKVYNPTPYYITLGEVKADSKTVALGKQRMLAPYSTVEVNLPGARPKSVSWNIINDDGRPTPRQSQSLDSPR